MCPARLSMPHISYTYAVPARGRGVSHLSFPITNNLSSFPLCLTLTPLPLHLPTSNLFSIMPSERTKDARRRIFVITHSLASSRTATRLATFLTCFNSKSRSSIGLNVEMKTGPGGLTLQSRSFMPSRGRSKNMSPRYALDYQLVLDPRSHAHLTDISTSKSHLYCSRRPPSGVYRFICSCGPL